MTNLSDLQILFLHGFTSSAKSSKALFLKEQSASLNLGGFTLVDFNPTPKDFEYLSVTGMINRLRQRILDCDAQRIMIIASSLGGLVATRYADQFGGIDSMLLLAPALFYHTWGTTDEHLASWKQAQIALLPHHGFQKQVPLRYTFHLDGLGYTEPVPPATDITILHGRQDDVVPIIHSREYAAAYPDKVQLIEVDADHRFTGQHAFIWEQTCSLLQN